MKIVFTFFQINNFYSVKDRTPKYLKSLLVYILIAQNVILATLVKPVAISEVQLMYTLEPIKIRELTSTYMKMKLALIVLRSLKIS